MKRFIAVILTVLIIFTMLNITSFADGDTSDNENGSIAGSDISSNDYYSYYQKFSDWNLGGEDIELSIGEDGNLTKTFEISDDTLYELELTYENTESSGFEIALYIDGELPFDSAEYIKFPAMYEDSDKKRTDGIGNQIAPEQIMNKKESVWRAREYMGISESPYRFAITAGKHQVTVKIAGEVDIKSAVLKAATEIQKYQKPESPKKCNEVITINAENAVLKSGRDLIPLSDGSSAMVYPANPTLTKLNYIGGSNWSSPGDRITWSFKVKKAGYYSFSAFYRQGINIGAASYRTLMIDDKVPFKEAERVKFKYCSDWEDFTFGGDNPYLFWLDEGEHTLSLTVTPGEMAEAYAKLKEISSDLGDLYVEITKIVGETVDMYRSYELFKQIPDFNNKLKDAIGSLNDLADKIKKLQDKTSGSNISTINSAIETLQKMLDNPYSAHQYKSAYYTSYINLSALIGTMVNMPLDLDAMYFVGYGTEPNIERASFFGRFIFSLKRFLATFSSDYNSVSSSAGSNQDLTLWVNWGRDQAQVLTALIQGKFVPEYNINVNVKVVNATLIQGILAGKGPDCMLHMARTEPVNLAMRGALEPLSQFDDLDEVLSQFNDDGAVPYTYNGQVYALPDTQTFNMLFVRTDILDSMGLEIPRTWEEFAEVTTTLQRSNLQVYMPQGLYTTFLAQEKLPLYDMDKGISTLNNTEQILCFEKYTNWFVKYKLPKSVGSFFDRFRIGVVPMGISDFSLITQLETAAPEIAKRWTVVELPGTPDEEGNIINYSAGGGTGCAITKLSKSPENAWKFLKWWVSEEIQMGYSSELESLLGPLGRVATSNVSAFEKLGWSMDVVPSLKSQQSAVVNFAELPGGYYVNRGIDQAFWNVVEANANVNDTMVKWGDIVNSEMLRKKAEYAKK